MPDISIQAITTDDLPHVMALQEECFHADLLEPQSLFEEMLTHSPKTHFIAFEGSAPLGYCFGHPCLAARRDFETGCGELSGNEDAYFLHDLCVSPKARGKGVAKMLFEAQVNAAKSKGFADMLGISVQNSSAFWEKLGFAMIEPYVYMGEQGQFMRKKLS